MATTDSPATLSELRTDFLNALKEVTGDSAINAVADRYVNKALQEIHQEPDGWPWAERRATILTHPGYSTGTVAIALATRTTVTGTSTLWNTAVTGMGFNNVRAGGKLTFAGGLDPYEVASVSNDTSLTLQDRYVGTTALSGATYQYTEDEYALAADFDRPIDARYFTEDRKIPLLGARAFYHRFARNTRRGPPEVACLIELGPSGSTSLRPRILFGPAPDRTYLLPYRYYTTNLAVSSTGTGQANLSAASDEPIVPPRFRQALVRKALECWTRDRKDDARADTYRAEADAILARARSSTSPIADRPRLAPAMLGYQGAAQAPYQSGRRRRYSTDTRFDTLED
jgi:hypothetical protein